MLLTVGGAVIASAYLLAQGSFAAMTDQLARRPGPVLFAGGLLFAGAGFLLLLNPRSHGWAWTLFVRIPKSVAGAVLLNLGYAGVVLGLWEWLDPRGFEQVAGAFRNAYDLGAVGRTLRAWFGLRG
jgi:hypothetical protein